MLSDKSLGKDTRRRASDIFSTKNKFIAELFCADIFEEELSPTFTVTLIHLLKYFSAVLFNGFFAVKACEFKV